MTTAGLTVAVTRSHKPSGVGSIPTLATNPKPIASGTAMPGARLAMVTQMWRTSRTLMQNGV